MRISHESYSEDDHFDILPFIAVMLIVLATLLFVTMVIASINVGIDAGEGWVPIQEKDSENKTPLLVEWDGESILIQKPTGSERIFLGRDKELWWSNANPKFEKAKLMQFINSIQSVENKKYVLFAIRPSGFENFQSLAAEFRVKGISIGYEPVEQGKRIKLILDKK